MADGHLKGTCCVEENLPSRVLRHCRGERRTVHLPQTWVWPFLLMLNMARQFCTCLLTQGRKTCPHQEEHVSVPSSSVVDAPTLKQPRCPSAGE